MTGGRGEIELPVEDAPGERVGPIIDRVVQAVEGRVQRLRLRGFEAVESLAPAAVKFAG